MTQQVISPYEPREHSIAFHARSQRFAILVCHRRFGKSVMCINDLIDKALQCQLPFPRYSYVAPYYSQVKTIAWNYLKHYAAPVIDKVMESELSVKLINGAIIRLFGGDNSNALRGVYNDGIILDEYPQMHPSLYNEVLFPTLLDRTGWVVFVGTPAGANSFYDLWEEAQGNDDWFTMMIKASESGIISEEELEIMRNSPGADSASYEQEMECSFTAAIRGAYYGELINSLESTHNGKYPYDPEKQVHLAFDIGYTDDTSIWFFQNNGKELAIIDFFTESGYSVDDILAFLRTKPYAYGTFYLPHDAKNKSFQTGKSVRELMTSAGAQCRLVPSLSVQDGIQAVRYTLPQCYFNTDNPDVRFGLNALKLYQREYDDKKKMFRESPKHDWTSHPSDAFRMFALATNPTSAVRQSAPLTFKKEENVGSNVLNLDNLYRDRKKVVQRI